MTPWLAYLCLGGSMALVGSYVGLSKLLVGVFPVFLLAGLRFLIAAVAMAGWVRRPADEAALGRGDHALVFLESFLGNFLFSICMLYGVQMSTALAAGVIMAALPGAVALLSRLVLGERLEGRVLAGIGCAVAGIALVSWSRHQPGAEVLAPAEARQALLGNLLLIGAVFCEASYVVIGKRLTGKLGPRRISSLVNLWGLALVAPLALWQAVSFDFPAVPLPTWTLLVFYALAASMITVWLWMTGLRQVPAARAGVFTVLLPVSAALVGVLLLGERFSAAQAMAFGLAMLGIVLATWPRR
ncbi:threonine/homoserine efflux transporter RhtA [Sphaerotilus hippei]|uniref:Threonine/homoserine efflux transporter RhtA n=1 Tax=Sphaerotilus hippei TaxID=744406 RepID=A0A318H8C4_9BURK|nr:DMT family transporter [Sphaerotilus hippei]PXW98122.1 threonine/homoserine efflux transporter RhtA [Sphaerotilus hippei]